jgi:hypothetical protein
MPTFADRGCRMVGAMDPHGRILGFYYYYCYLFKLQMGFYPLAVVQ